jgi:NTP pyrophosphatase (non-canonical NTP hydrolase)
MNSTEQQIFSDVAREVYTLAWEKGFHPEYSARLNGESVTLDRMAVFCANLHGEVSELWEAARKGSLGKQCDKACNLTCAEEELADIVIRALDTAYALGIDIGRAIHLKNEYNKTRPHMHGKLA